MTAEVIPGRPQYAARQNLAISPQEWLALVQKIALFGRRLECLAGAGAMIGVDEWKEQAQFVLAVLDVSRELRDSLQG